MVDTIYPLLPTTSGAACGRSVPEPKSREVGGGRNRRRHSTQQERPGTSAGTTRAPLTSLDDVQEGGVRPTAHYIISCGEGREDDSRRPPRLAGIRASLRRAGKRTELSGERRPLGLSRRGGPPGRLAASLPSRSVERHSPYDGVYLRPLLPCRPGVASVRTQSEVTQNSVFHRAGTRRGAVSAHAYLHVM